MAITRPDRPSAQVTGARAAAQRAKLDAQDEQRQRAPKRAAAPRSAKRKTDQGRASRRSGTTLEQAIAHYLLDHEGGNASPKTLQWHQTALGLLRTFLQEERNITQVTEIDAPDINAWFASMRKTPTRRGKLRSERTIQTYARSARAFFH